MKEVSKHKGYYNTRINGCLEEYLGACRKDCSAPAFRGPRYYKTLCGRGHLVQDQSFIEIIKDSGLVGERYLVTEGLKLMSGSGKLYMPKEILRENRVWEARHLARPIRRSGKPVRFIN